MNNIPLTAVLEKGKTIAVLGSGLNNIFPPENKGLVAKIASGYGAVISEFSPNSPPLPGNFPLRNLALEQGREVFAVPPNDLIGDGARAVFHPEEILDEISGLVTNVGAGIYCRK